MFGGDAFGVELHAFDRQVTVAQPHDRAIGQPGCDLKAGRQRRAVNDQAVIAGGGERRRQARENALTCVVHRAHLAVNDLMAAHHIAPEGLTNRLMPQTHAKQRNARLGSSKRQGQANSRRRWVARAGGQHNCLWSQGHGRLHIHRIVAHHADIRPQLAQIMHEVVGKAVVVVDQKQHIAGPWRIGDEGRAGSVYTCDQQRRGVKGTRCGKLGERGLMQVIRGFLAGVAWGGVVAGLGLVVISQVAPRPVAQSVGAEEVAEVAPPVRPVAEVAKPAPQPEVTEPDPQPVAVPPVAVAPAAPAKVAKTPPEAPTVPKPAAAVAVEVLPPPADVLAAAEVPTAPAASGNIARPAIPAVTVPAAPAPSVLAAPDGLSAPTKAPVAGLGLATDVPPPDPQEALLLPAPEPFAEPAPARIAPDQGLVAETMPPPGASPPPPDAAPDLPVAKPLPAPVIDATPPVAPETTAESQSPATDVQPVEPIFGPDAVQTLTPKTGLPGAGLPGTDGVRVGQLPKIGDTEATEAPPVTAGDAPPVQRFARTFENPDAKPLFGILLRDTGAADLDRAALAQISFPVTFVVDPMQPGAAEAAEIYRRGGQEVLMLASGIPEGATPGDLEQSFQALTAVLPEAVGVMDLPTGGFQANRPLASQVVPILVEQGRGLVTFDAGLNAADQEARRAALPSAMIFRVLDAEGEDTPLIRRYLDRAAFKAAQEGRVVVLGDTRPETVAALLEWAVEGRAAAVALAPITAVMRVP